ncbi:hypothetical protein STA3757_14080 [Stanieria sp. NIES-3757]|nr:hypothetical protein STA3757_14080 [Stanieria sp. NIES-3757]
MNHQLEWQASCVDEELTNLNVIPLNGFSPSEYLLYSDAIPRRNDGRVTEEFLQLYAHTAEGGWWCSGVDVLTGEEDLWGCFKPAQPRQSINQDKPIKYEHPPKTATGLFALKVPVRIWEKIAHRYRINIIASDLDRTRSDLGFWQWLIEHPEIPLCITEGAKKAGALLSAGYVAVGLPGINNGYRTPKDETGKRIGKSYLIAQLQELVKQQREVYFVFDQDTKPNTIKAVNTAIKKTGYLLEQFGCTVKVVNWKSSLGKGVDDLIANHSQSAFECAYHNALTFDTWKAQAWNRLTHLPQLELNCAYLSSVNLPDSAQLIGIKSPKGTGKTKFLEKIVADAITLEQKVLVIGHRIQLVQALCQRFNLNYVTEIKANLTSDEIGFGLCIDSLHPNSQAQFNPSDWSDSIVILDEVEQVIWHCLNSSTCKTNRVAILRSLKLLLQNVLTGKGKVYAVDADLSDISLDYLISLSGTTIEPYIIYNDWQPSSQSAWQVYNYQDSTPKKIVKDLEKYIKQGGKPMVCLSAQKLTSKWGTRTLEAYFRKKFPHKKILRLDSESLADPQHPAYGCITKLNEVLSNYEVVLASPSIETGISIELSNHFTSVWCIAQGIQGENAVRQTLARVRANIPRYLWCATYGFNRIGNGSTSIPSLLTSGHRLTQLNIRLLQQSDFESLEDIDTGFQAESLLCWAKMAVRYNASMINYRESILSALRDEGHQILPPPATITTPNQTNSSQDREPNKDKTPSLLEAIAEVREQNYQNECKAIASAKTLTAKQYQNLKKRLVKTLVQKHQLKKYELQQRYHLPVTPKLIALDDDGWYDKIRLHYFLTVGRPFLADRDAKVALKLIQQGEGSLFLPDFNGSQLGASVGTMEVLGISILINTSERELRNSDRDLQALATTALQHRSEIKTTLGIGLAKNSSPITIIRRLLEKIDYGIRCIRYERKNQKRVRVYQLVKPEDLREQVFHQWLTIDSQHPGHSLFWHENCARYLQVSPLATETSQYVQLSLNLTD